MNSISKIENLNTFYKGCELFEGISGQPSDQNDLGDLVNKLGDLVHRNGKLNDEKLFIESHLLASDDVEKKLLEENEVLRDNVRSLLHVQSENENLKSLLISSENEKKVLCQQLENLKKTQELLNESIDTLRESSLTFHVQGKSKQKLMFDLTRSLLEKKNAAHQQFQMKYKVERELSEKTFKCRHLELSVKDLNGCIQSLVHKINSLEMSLKNAKYDENYIDWPDEMMHPVVQRETEFLDSRGSEIKNSLHSELKDIIYPIESSSNHICGKSTKTPVERKRILPQCSRDLTGFVTPMHSVTSNGSSDSENCSKISFSESLNLISVQGSLLNGSNTQPKPSDSAESLKKEKKREDESLKTEYCQIKSSLKEFLGEIQYMAGYFEELSRKVKNWHSDVLQAEKKLLEDKGHNFKSEGDSRYVRERLDSHSVSEYGDNEPMSHPSTDLIRQKMRSEIISMRAHLIRSHDLLYYHFETKSNKFYDDILSKTCKGDVLNRASRKCAYS